MKLTTVLLIGSFLHLSAAGIAQNITFSKKNVTLEDVFTQIRKQSGFNIVLSDRKVNLATKVDVNFNNTPVEESIKNTLSGLPLSYKIDNNTIIIREQEKSLLDKVVKYFSAIDIRGRVVDENGNGLAGATVKVKGSAKSVLTNKDGEFFLPNVNEESVLVLSYVGYDVKEVPAGRDLGDVSLVLNSGKLEEVKINAGYYTVTDRERTGSISRVTAEEIGRQPVNNPLMALVGNVPGLQVTQSNGVPGGGFTVRIRGQNSIISGNDPLYIIDGVVFPSTGIASTSSGINTTLGLGGANPLSLINPNDIESIEVLKDADATAIYGSRGANGVIQITTKKGKQGDSKITANISQGFSQVAHKIDLLNTQEYLQMRREAYFTNDKLTTTSPTYATQYDINGAWKEDKYTDWQEVLIGGTAPLTNVSLNLTGGNNKSNYLISGNYVKEGTVVPGNFGSKIYGVRSNVNLGAAEDRFQAAFTVNLYRRNSDLYAQGLMSNVFLSPNQPDAFDEYGQLNWANNTVGVNPFAKLLVTNTTQSDNLITNLSLSYRVIKDLTLKASIGYNSIKRNEFIKSPLASEAPSNGYTSTFRSSAFGNNYNNNLSFEPQINYKKQMGKNEINGLLGMSLQQNDAQINVINASNFTSDDLLGNIGSAAILTNTENSFVQYRYFAVFARLNYDFNNRFFVNLTGRRDGSSRFGPDKQFANFGALGAAWIFSQENLIKEKLPFISFGKLRGSYGITGNDQIADYSFLQLWRTSSNYQGSSTLIPSTVASNPLFSWETTRKLEIALQLGFFKRRLNFDISWFRNKSSNQLLYQSFPLSTGLSGTYLNLPAEIQNTGWEFETNAEILNRGAWTWSAGFNISIPRNKLLSYPDLATSGNAVDYQIGESLNILKTYHIGVDPQSGSYVIEDKNGNGSTDLEDRYLIKFLGQKYYGGLNSSLKFKQFTFDFLLSFVKQKGKNYMSNTVAPGRYNTASPNNNQYSEVLNRWQSVADENVIARYSTTSVNNTLYSNANRFGDVSVVDASYLRLRNVSLAYSLPSKLVSRLKIGGASISLQGQNLFTVTNYIGFDPETQGVNLPPLRTVLIGLNLNF